MGKRCWGHIPGPLKRVVRVGVGPLINKIIIVVIKVIVLFYCCNIL